MMIPRIELSTAVLETRLDKMIRRELDLPVDSSIFWTDSTCILQYIENKDKRFQIFVVNRVSAILDQSTAIQWRYVETSLNPADKASRGMTVDTLLRNDCWSQGPSFLKQPKETWPQRPADIREISDSDPEVKKTVEVFANKANDQSNHITRQ